MEIRSRTDFLAACETFRRSTLRGMSLATIVSGSISFFLFLSTRRLFHQVFRVEIGGKLGDGLMGLTFGLASVSPLLLFLVWSRHRAKQLGLQCHTCRNIFTRQNLDRVRDSGRCLACGTQQFCDVDLCHPMAVPDLTEHIAGKNLCVFIPLGHSWSESALYSSLTEWHWAFSGLWLEL